MFQVGYRNILFGVAFIVLILFGTGYYLYRQYFSGIGPAIAPPPEDIVDLFDEAYMEPNESTLPLTIDEQFSINIFADDVPGARDIAIGPQGDLWVTLRSNGQLVHLQATIDGGVNKEVYFASLNNPHGLAFHPKRTTRLYVAEETDLWWFDITDELKTRHHVADLPKGGRHVTRSIIFDQDKILVSIGSTCDTCIEDDDRHGTVIIMNDDGSDQRLYAAGLRNAVFFTKHPQTNAIWVTEMGRDFLGNDLPPDEVNILQDGGHFGWPHCYGDKVYDTRFDEQGDSSFCQNTIVPVIELPAHVAPLGLTFFGRGQWGSTYEHDLLVAYHGSWNSTDSVGYSIVRHKFDSMGHYLGSEDFITGWLTPDGALGRPVDIVVANENNIFISDDKEGVIYQVQFAGPQKKLDKKIPIEENKTEECRVTGCSAHVCADHEVVTDCAYLSEYSCYNQANCERQENGECGWTQTTELIECLEAN